MKCIFIILDALIQDSPFLLVNIYSPTKPCKQIQIFDKIACLIEEKMSQSDYQIILGGDFNVTFEPNLDCSGGKPSVKNSVKSLEDIISKYVLTDIWRVRNPTKKTFHLETEKPVNPKKTRFLVNQRLPTG